MTEGEWLAERFEANRTHLRAVAYRMLGAVSEADDAVQEAWLRLSRSDAAEVENLRAWLTTVVAPVCPGMKGPRRFRRGGPLRPGQERPAPSPRRGAPRPPRPRADPQPRGRPRPRARGAAGRLGRP